MGATFTARPRRPGRARQRGFWNFVIPALATVAGSLLGGNLSRRGQEETNEQNAELAQRQMDFQREMSSTAYQRATADMQQAGLNPMLAYQQGGASAPSGATASMSNPNVQLGANVSSSAQQALGLYQAYATSQNTEANTQLLHASADKVRSETMAHNMNTAKLAAEIKEREGHAGVAQVEKWIREGTKAWDAKRRMAEGDISEFEAKGRELTFSADVERRKSESRRAAFEADLAGLGIAEAKSTSDFYTKAETFPKWLQLLLQAVRPLSGHR